MDLIVGALPHDEQSAALAYVLGSTPEDLRVPYAWGANPLKGGVQEAQRVIDRTDKEMTALLDSIVCDSCGDGPEPGKYCAQCGRQA